MSKLMFCTYPVSIISSSDDCISRNDVIDAFGNSNAYYTSDYIVKIIKSLPSVEPKPKKARWIECGINYWACSNDGCTGECFGHKDKYCNECGARMEE